MKLVNWNIEWMNDWYVNGTQVAFRQNNTNRGITDVADLAQRVANVIKQMDPDVLTVEEGPSDIREMQLFVDTYLSNNQGEALFEVLGGIDGGAQKIYALIKKSGSYKEADIPTDAATEALQESWEADTDGDYTLEDYDFTRLPLVVDGKLGNNGIRIVVLHTKSKYVHRGEALWNNLATRREFVIAALKNRRRISSEAMRTRKYLDTLLNQDANSRVVVTGDFNDGPGTDYFEQRYLTHNVTDILLGSTFYPEQLFTHTFLNRVAADDRYTAIFDDYVDNTPNRKILLDHILVSPALAGAVQNSDILHQEYEAGTDTNASGRQRDVSDHRPVFLEL